MGNLDPFADATVSDGRPTQTVQVRLMGAARPYDYTWHGDTPLAVGDYVDLPGNVVSPEGCIGRVESLKPPAWKGELKPVMRKLDDPWTVLFSRVRDEKDASDAWQRARKAGLSTDRLAELTELAKVVLSKRAKATAAERKPYAQDGSTAHRATLTETPAERLERRMRETDPEAWVEMRRDQTDAAMAAAAQQTLHEEAQAARNRMGS